MRHAKPPHLFLSPLHLGGGEELPVVEAFQSKDFASLGRFHPPYGRAGASGTLGARYALPDGSGGSE
jgi:hypothetical protein